MGDADSGSVLDERHRSVETATSTLRIAGWTAMAALAVALVFDVLTRRSQTTMTPHSVAWMAVWIALLAEVVALVVSLWVLWKGDGPSRAAVRGRVSAVVVVGLLVASLFLRRHHWDLGTATPWRAVAPVAAALLVLAIDGVGDLRNRLRPER